MSAKSIPVLVSLILITCIAAASTNAVAAPKTIPIGSNPESACRGFGGHLYVTMINGDEPGDGTIVRLVDDKPIVFAKGFNAPKGIVFVANHLVVTDEKTIWKIDQNGVASKLVEEKDFPAPIEFLNDIAASLDGSSVFVSEMSSPQPMFDPSGERKLWDIQGPEAKDLPNKGCVYQITLQGRVSIAAPPGKPQLRFPNGVAVVRESGKEQLFVGDFFSGEILTYHNGAYHSLATGMRGIDGLTVTPTAFYASSWTEGKVWKVDRKTRSLQILHEGLKTAADFFYDAAHKQLVIPDMVGGTLTFLPLP